MTFSGLRWYQDGDRNTVNGLCYQWHTVTTVIGEGLNGVWKYCNKSYTVHIISNLSRSHNSTNVPIKSGLTSSQSVSCDPTSNIPKWSLVLIDPLTTDLMILHGLMVPNYRCLRFLLHQIPMFQFLRKSRYLLILMILLFSVLLVSSSLPWRNMSVFLERNGNIAVMPSMPRLLLMEWYLLSMVYWIHNSRITRCFWYPCVN